MTTLRPEPKLPTVEDNFTTDAFTFQRRMPGKPPKKGTADQYKYIVEKRVINGQTVDCKVYESNSVKYNKKLRGEGGTDEFDMETVELELDELFGLDTYRTE